MTNKIKSKEKRLDNDELLELEYEQLESSEKKRPKRLLSKEDKSKKSASKLVKGRVLECFTNNYYRVRIADEDILCPLSGRFKNVDFRSIRSIVVVGDYVNVDLSSDPRIEEVFTRKNTLKRSVSTHRNREVEVTLAANIDQLIITSSCFQPPINLNLVDRYICSANLSNLESVICITKKDLLDKNEVDPEFKEELANNVKYYKDQGYKVLMTSSVTGEGIQELKEILRGKDTIFSGKSGTGKTTIINCLEPNLHLKTGPISTYSNKGKHTTSNSLMIEWSFGGYLIDTPGIKTFGITKEAKYLLPRMFPGFNELSVECKFSSCTHQKEFGCRVLEALKNKEIPQERHQSYLNLYNTLFDKKAESDII